MALARRPDGRSRNGYHVAVVSFANWLVRVERMKTKPSAKIAKVDVELDRRRTRRSLSAAEVERIAEAAEKAPKRPPMKDRARSRGQRVRPE